MRAYKKRGSRKATDKIEAIMFRGFEDMPVDRRGKPTFPDWLPSIAKVVFDREGTYDTDEIDPTPQGEIWRMGNGFARFGLADGHQDAHIGDFIVRYSDGHIGVLTKSQLHQNYRAA